VSTDCKEIAAIAEKAGAEIPFIRPKALADDYTDTSAVVKHAIRFIREKLKLEIDFICCLYATAALLQAKNLLESFELLQSSNANYVFSALEYSHPIQRAFTLTTGGYIQRVSLDAANKRTQDLEISYHDAGQFYWAKPNNFLKDEPIFSSKSIAYVLGPHAAIDIDTLEDFKLAEQLYLLRETN
jgi:pseudaminic acid cytidylyltransferase